MLENFLKEAKKQGFAVLLLLGAVLGLYYHFTSEISTLREEQKAEIKELKNELKNCNEEKIEMLKNNKDDFENSRTFKNQIIAVLPKRVRIKWC